MNRIGLALAVILLLTVSAHAANRFVEAGMPSPSREWYGREYTRAAELLANGTAALPTHADADGREILGRVLNAENFSLARNRTVPFVQRMEDFMAMQQAFNALQKRYAAEANRGANLNREVSGFVAYSLRMSTVMIELVDEFLPTIAKDDRYEIRMAGLQRMKRGVEAVFSGAEESLGERSFYTHEDLEGVVDAMVETLPQLNGVFSENFRVELEQRLAQRIREFRSKSVSEKFERMRAVLTKPSATQGGGSL